MYPNSWDRVWDPFGELRREMGRLFESFDSLPRLRSAGVFPRINFFDARDRYVLTAELPGLTASDLELTVTGDQLMLRGQRRRRSGSGVESYRRQERIFGNWTRSLTLPDRIESDEIRAHFEHGVLTVTLPKAETAKPRQITVTAGAPQKPTESHS